MRSTSMSFESMRLFPYVVFFFYFLFSNLPLPVLCCSFYYSLHLLGRRLRSPLAYFQTAVFHKPQTTPYTTTDSHFIIPCCQPCILHLSFSLFVSLPLSLSFRNWARVLTELCGSALIKRRERLLPSKNVLTPFVMPQMHKEHTVKFSTCSNWQDTRTLFASVTS